MLFNAVQIENINFENDGLIKCTFLNSLQICTYWNRFHLWSLNWPNLICKLTLFLHYRTVGPGSGLGWTGSVFRAGELWSCRCSVCSHTTNLVKHWDICGVNVRDFIPSDLSPPFLFIAHWVQLCCVWWRIKPVRDYSSNQCPSEWDLQILLLFLGCFSKNNNNKNNCKKIASFFSFFFVLSILKWCNNNKKD